ncbi:MAG: hypothetical protein SFV51_03985 [Bryobacteraceae bacterium]|nr:hypothetical protein [Bryobacteraceae bacterium]
MNLHTLRRGKTALAMALLAAACAQHSLAQVTPHSILQIDMANYVIYSQDTTDLAKYAADPNATTANSGRNFYLSTHLADVVAVNGQQVKGNFASLNRVIALRPAPPPGQAIADSYRNNIGAVTIEILKGDGTAIGTIIAHGLVSGPPPPGSPVPVSAILQGGHNLAITGGTGAFLGVRGQLGAAPPVARIASITEDPANRRRNGVSGTWRWTAHLIPMSTPQVVTSATGPAVFHSDFSPVTTARPARSGEMLIVQATGLGPTVPSVDPGQPFPIDANLPVNSPLSVKVNGQDAEVVAGVGWPGLVDTYRVDFRVPSGMAAGMASVELSAAWIGGTAVRIPVQ